MVRWYGPPEWCATPLPDPPPALQLALACTIGLDSSYTPFIPVLVIDRKPCVMERYHFAVFAINTWSSRPGRYHTVSGPRSRCRQTARGTPCLWATHTCTLLEGSCQHPSDKPGDTRASVSYVRFQQENTTVLGFLRTSKG